MLNEDSIVPVREDEEIDNVICEAEGAQGDGLFKIDRFVIFVKEASVGRRYKIRITKVTASCGFGEIVSELD